MTRYLKRQRYGCGNTRVLWWYHSQCCVHGSTNVKTYLRTRQERNTMMRYLDDLGVVRNGHISVSLFHVLTFLRRQKRSAWFSDRWKCLNNIQKTRTTRKFKQLWRVIPRVTLTIIRKNTSRQHTMHRVSGICIDGDTAMESNQSVISVRITFATELHRPLRRNFTRLAIELKGCTTCSRQIWYTWYRTRAWTSDKRYLMVVINAFSKFTYAVPLKTKTGAEEVHALEIILAANRIRFPQTYNGNITITAPYKRC